MLYAGSSDAKTYTNSYVQVFVILIGEMVLIKKYFKHKLSQLYTNTSIYFA